MDIGFIGLGNMGAHMARRLIEAGHKVIVYDTRQEAIGDLAAKGAVAARSPKEIADMVETVMASLPTPDIVLKVATGPDGVIEGKKVRRFVDLSTTGSVMAQRIFKELGARNIVQIDAPVSGGVIGAEKGTVAVMASGPRGDVEAVEPALKVIGKFFFIGEKSGAGQTMKLCNNVLSAAGMAATSESILMGVKAGLDPRVRVAMDVCCLTDYESLIQAHGLSKHGVYYFVPGLLKHFDTFQINELIVPRAHLSVNGRRDELTPPAGVEQVRDKLLPLYRTYGRAEDCKIELFDCAHEELPEMRREILAWMDSHLMAP